MSVPLDNSILFVCMGNICRSPTAEAVFRKMAAAHPRTRNITIDSAGTYGGHAGARADPRAVRIAAARGYNLAPIRARAITLKDFEKFDLVVAMDSANVRALTEMVSPNGAYGANDISVGQGAEKIAMLMDYVPNAAERDVPDPYYGSDADFEHVLDMIESGCRALLTHIVSIALPNEAGRADNVNSNKNEPS